MYQSNKDNFKPYIKMKKTAFSVKKWLVRACVVIGGALGFTACHSTKTAETDPSTRPTQPSTPPERPPYINEPQPLVYGPPPMLNRIERDTIEPIKDVYGPPVIVEPDPEVVIEPEQE